MQDRWGMVGRGVLALGLGVAAWGALGVLTLGGGASGAGRVGVLPSWGVLGLLCVAALVLLTIVTRTAARTFTLCGALLAIVPWLPVPLPTAALAWTGPWSAVLWALSVAALLATMDGRIAAGWRHPWLAGPRAAWTAGVLTLVVYAAVGARVAPVVPGGDEPHYLIITQSLLSDGDLRIENNHQRGDYLAYTRGPLKPDYLRRGVDRQIYSIHLPGVSALVLPAFAVGGYPLVKLWLALFAACGAGVAWRVAYAFSGRASAAWFAWAATALTAPFLFLAFTVYPDGPGGVLVALAVAALVSVSQRPNRRAWWWMLVGLAPAAMPWLHPRFSVIAGALGIVLAARAWNERRRGPAAVAFLAVPVASALAWFGYYVTIYGSPNPSVAYGHYTQMSMLNAGRGLIGLAFDQQFGLVATAPVYALVVAGAVLLARRDRRLGLEWAAIVVPYVVVSAMYHMWWGGHSSPARFLGSVMLACALPLAVAWQSAKLASTRALQLGLLLTSLVLAAALSWVDEGRLVFNTRDGFALWAVWASRSADVARALPSVFRTAPVTALTTAACWVGSVLGVWLVVRGLEQRAGISRAAAALTLSVGVVAATSASMTASWRLEGVSGLAPVNGQLELLQRASSSPLSEGVAYDPPRIVTPAAVARLVTLDGAGIAGRPSWAWLWVPRLPAGRYRVWLDNRVPGASFDVDLIVGRGDAAIETWSFRDLPVGRTSHDVVLPWSVRSLALRGPAAGRESLRGVTVEVLEVSAGPASPGPRVTAARRYGQTIVMAVGDEAFLEPSGVWTAGQTDARLALVTSADHTGPALFLRAGAVVTDVELSAGEWRDRFTLRPGEVREVSLPGAAGPTMLRVKTSAGFRPSVVEPGSTDTRFLGVWLEFR